ncbi:MAG: acylphosphatase [Mycobacteriales bacterium]
MPDSSEHLESGDPVRLTACVAGRVQGVGFRWWVRRRALELGLTGSAANLADGRVEIVAEGPQEICRQLLDALHGPDVPGRPGAVVTRWGQAQHSLVGFTTR